jgi:tetratricopeptide (TPR) repeat protein
MSRNFYNVAKIVSFVLIFGNSVMPVAATKVPDANLKISDKLSDEALAEQMKQFAVAIKGAIAGVSAKFKANADTEKLIASLPSKEAVVQTKDVQRFREYSGLSEIYLFNNKISQAESLRSWVVANAAKVLGADDPNPAVLDSDFGLFYYDSGNFSRAETLFKETMPRLEAQMSVKPDEVRNNLISVYAGLAEIAFNRGKKEDARRFLDKINQIAPAQ